MNDSTAILTPVSGENLSGEELQLKANLELLVNTMERIALFGSRTGNGLGMSHNGERDLWKVFGYPEAVDAKMMRQNFGRDGILARIACAYPEATWSAPPEIVDDEESQDETTFEKAFQELAKKLKLWHYINRADILAQLGRYSVIFVGLTGSTEPKDKRSSGAKVAYLMPYGEASAQVKSLVGDVKDPRFGKPEKYDITVMDLALSGSTTLVNPTAGKSTEVHASRVIHIAENLLDNDVYGTSIVEQCFNRLMDLEKVMGGGAEVWWLNSRGGLNVNADKDANISKPEEIKKDINDFVNQLKRVLLTKGMQVNPIQFEIESPAEIVGCIFQFISGTTGIPVRILTGSERGELSSTQDDDNWLSRVDERRKNHAEQTILRPLIDLLIETGDLPQPKDGKYEVKWPELVSLSEEKKADIATKKAQAMATYVNAMGADLLVTPQQFVEEVLHMEYREDEIRELEEEQAQQEAEEQAALQEEGGVEHERAKELIQVKAGMAPPKLPAGAAKPNGKVAIK